MNKLILASQSPRRKALLQQIGIHPICRPVDIDESFKQDKSPLAYCQRLAAEKAQEAWQQSDKTLKVLAADTIVVFANEILGKPQDHAHAISTLQKLSGQTHEVITAVALINHQRLTQAYSISEVQFGTIDSDEIHTYVKSVEPMDKAGAYGIQGYAARWIKFISGSYSGIMGLPLYQTTELLR